MAIDGLSPKCLLLAPQDLALLAYLACQQKPVPRSYLAGLFWPDKPERQGRRNLSRELSHLALHLPGCLVGNFHDFQFKPKPEYWLDIWAFEAHTLLLARANRTSDERLRRSFLENVAVNRAIVLLHSP